MPNYINGETPLHVAAKIHNAEMAKYLISQGVDLNALNND